ncbi:MAG TPA: efflux transporter outer membrane subunit [Candidatus Krumholzibacteria bacterium]|nr:efflux transporter outer membrane subunit [Candidatus Krumholzibacteria bacterium]HPD71862.1 efflux transporter outer membrane subunit [Candidatus Krumholzibacteria bacterium]HRY41205.1 efflux transporter outer membrane subunit [Candidatus Krumholzibacteria bacterium]
MSTRRAILPAIIGLLLALPACTPGPVYRRPEIAMPEQWRDETAPSAETLANLPWWDLFGDPALQDLIRTALRENPDLQIAAERTVEAAARLGFARADLWPRVDLSATAGRSQLSRRGATPIPDAQSNLVTLYDVSVPVTWEIDLFGRIRSASAAARAEFLATEAGRQAVAISLVAQVASAYASLRAADLQLEVARRTVESRRESIELARMRFEGGVTSERDWRQAEAEFYRTLGIVQDLERLQRQLENAISVLVGRFPGEVLRGRPLPDIPVIARVPTGLPSDLLDRRPDLRAAEQTLVATNANIGQAKALLFPRIALTGDIGEQSTELETLFEVPSRTFSLAGNLLQPIFNAGKNRRRVEVSESVMRQSLYAYEKAVLQAFREVEDALVAFGKQTERRESQRLRVESVRELLRLADLAYSGGVISYLEVLDAQRSLFGAELDEIQAMDDQIASFVQLYKALGGGWPVAPAGAAADE